MKITLVTSTVQTEENLLKTSNEIASYYIHCKGFLE